MKFKSENKLLAVFSYASLTDIVFLLLIFFLLSSSFVIQPGIKVQLPTAETGEPQTERQVIITVTEGGGLFFNNEPIQIADLGSRLLPVMERDPDNVVIIQADRTVSLQNTIEVIDIAKAVGATRFNIATEPLRR
jgi:biopolymer transport protein ExbD